MMMCVLVMVFMLLFSFPVYASTASASDATRSDAQRVENDIEKEKESNVLIDRPDFYLDALADMEDDTDLLRGIYSEVLSISDSLYGPGATASDADRMEDTDPLESPPDNIDGEEASYSVAPVDPLSSEKVAEDVYTNVLRFDVTFRGDDYILLIPPEYRDNLYIDADNKLWNMSTQTVTGRFVDARFDPAVDRGTLVYLTPCLGNNFSTIREYGSPNYVREYYWSSSNYDRLTYDTFYGDITVNKYHHSFYVSETLDYILIFIVLGGALFLCLRNYKHY